MQFYQHRGIGIVGDWLAGIHAGPVKNPQRIELAFTAQQGCLTQRFSHFDICIPRNDLGTRMLRPHRRHAGRMHLRPFVHLINHIHMVRITFRMLHRRFERYVQIALVQVSCHDLVAIFGEQLRGISLPRLQVHALGRKFLFA